MRKKKGTLINLLICGTAFAEMVAVLLMDCIDDITGAFTALRYNINRNTGGKYVDN